MACANIIGMRGVCESTEAKYFIDDHGITLNHASKLAHSSNHTGKDLFESKLAVARDITINEILLDGFNFNKILSTYVNKFTDDTTTVATFTLTNFCEHAGIYINYFNVKVIGTGTLRVLLNGVDLLNLNPSTPLVNDVSDETIKIELNDFIPNDSVILLMWTGVTIQDAEGWPAEVNGYIKCDKSYFLCKYVDVWAYAWMYKTMALMLNEKLLNPNYNDLIAYAAEGNELALKIAQLDTSLTLVPFEQLPNKKGAFQREIERINKIIKVPKCDCCFECEGTVSFDYVNL